MEAKIYKTLQGIPGIPKIIAVGTEGELHGLVMELLGPNIEQLQKFCNGHFTVRTTLFLAEQMVSYVYVTSIDIEIRSYTFKRFIA